MLPASIRLGGNIFLTTIIYWLVIAYIHKINRFLRLFTALAILLAVLPGCTVSGSGPASAFSAWVYSDLRFMQAATADPEHSLIAVYTRQDDFDLEVRLDFLDLAAPLDFDTYLALDTRGGGNTRLPFEAAAGAPFDLLVKIPAVGTPSAVDSQLNPVPGLVPRVSDDPGLDTMVVALNRASLVGNPGALGLQVFITPAGKTNVLCQTPAISPGSPRPAQAPLLMIFWNTLPSSTPAQTLRRWDGAHTGPMGGRHGLSNLVRAAAGEHIPLVLADLKQSASLAGLNAVGGKELLLQAALRGDVFLPDPANGDPLAASQSLALNREAAQTNGFTTGEAAFGAFSKTLPGGYAAYFAALNDPTHIVTWQGKRLVPLPGEVYAATDSAGAGQQVSQDGISMAIREELVATALSGDPGKLVVLGGSLPDSIWGESSVAPAAFAYLAAHPWIRPLDWQAVSNLPAQGGLSWPLPARCQDLLCSPKLAEIIPYTSAGQPVASGIHLGQLQADLREKLAALPQGAFTRQAWQSYLALTQPTTNPQLAGLQANALGQAGYLLEAARWEAHPASSTDCSQDLDFDGAPECVLASPDWLAILKTDGGRLVFAASRTAQGAAQWVGAISQFAVGLSDPSEWHAELGPAGDPGEIPGAFALADRGYEAYQASVQPGQVTLQSADGGVRKTFTLSPEGLKVDLSFAQAETVNIPLTLAPQDWFAAAPVGAGQPVPQQTAHAWVWQSAAGAGLRVTLAGSEFMPAASFLDSASLMSTQENPNLAYPRGHYLPYPFALLTIQGTQLSLLFSAH
jgi:hypothetical protein